MLRTGMPRPVPQDEVIEVRDSLGLVGLAGVAVAGAWLLGGLSAAWTACR